MAVLKASSHPDQTRWRDGDGEPVSAVDFQEESQANHDNCGNGMNPGVVLRNSEVPDAAKGMAETLQSFDEWQKAMPNRINPAAGESSTFLPEGDPGQGARFFFNKTKFADKQSDNNDGNADINHRHI